MINPPACGPGDWLLGLASNEGLGPMVPGRDAATSYHERMPYPACAGFVDLPDVLGGLESDMEFMGLLKEWLTLRKWEDDRELLRTPESRHRDWERMQWLEAELNRMVRAGIARDMAPGPVFVQPMIVQPTWVPHPPWAPPFVVTC